MSVGLPDDGFGLPPGEAPFAAPPLMDPMGGMAPPAAAPAPVPPLVVAPPSAGGSTPAPPPPATTMPPVAPLPPAAAIPPVTGVSPQDVQARGAQELAQGQQLAGAEEQIARDTGALEARKVGIEQEQAAGVAAENARHAKVTELLSARASEREEAAWAAHEQAVATLGKAKIEDYWSGQSTGSKIAAGIALAFGAFGAGLSAAGGMNTGNLAAQQLMQNIDMDYKRQVKAVEFLQAAAERTRLGITDVRQDWKDRLAQVDARHQAILKSVEATAIANLKAQGFTAAQIAENANVLAIQKKRAESEASTQRRIAKNTDEAMKSPLEQRMLGVNIRKGEADIIETQASTRLKDATVSALGAAATSPSSATAIYGPNGKIADIDKAEAPKVRAAIADRQVLIQQVKDLKSLVATGPAKSVADMGKREALVGQIRITLKGDGFAALGVIQGGDMDMLDDMMGGKLGTMAGKTGAKLDEVITYVNRKMTAKLQAVGVPGDVNLDALSVGSAPGGSSGGGGKLRVGGVDGNGNPSFVLPAGATVE